ncbi:Ibr domain protein (macronuclear) [Tetrahymena thermophila SB210]|uniref:RBR-type E3 ubiquitin transferase n=1 Tax=Tetrahymena thermophila (strain SB210) TaxID=312017 RepID=Q22XZ2_TETTS|nr:Ibr domain protein [Tetrahymena thermophila SB210]EAR90232.2 Ibr domain protein [Tetrahymena thermophila SB210]|eukprot:XP_001010477.2 Ibr domain protein [Tetrahymena thermophila SB210]
MIYSQEECIIQSTRDIVELPNISKITQASKIYQASKICHEKNPTVTQTMITGLTNSTYESISGTKNTIYQQQNSQKEENLKNQHFSQKSILLSNKEQDQAFSIFYKNDQASNDSSKNQNNDMQIETNSILSNKSRNQSDQLTQDLKAKWVFTRLLEMNISQYTYQDVINILCLLQQQHQMNKEDFLQYMVDKNFIQSQLKKQEHAINIDSIKGIQHEKFKQVLTIKQDMRQVQKNQGDEKIPDIENSLVQERQSKNEQILQNSFLYNSTNTQNMKQRMINRHIQFRCSVKTQTKNYFLSEAEGGVTCNICCLSYQREYFYTLDSCNHLFCKNCIIQYLENCINTSQVLKIKCPDENCKVEFTDQILQKILDTKTFQKYLKFKELKIINSDPTLKWCNRTGCTFYCKINLNDPKIICKCGHQMCFQCGNNWHEGKTCDEVIQEEFQGAIQKYVISFCPTCKSKVQKASGCNRIYCPICSQSFCWICRTPNISYAHFSHLNILGCPGKQFSRSNPDENPQYQRIVMFIPRLIVFICILAAFTAIMPFFLVGLAIITPNYFYWNNVNQNYAIPKQKQKQRFVKAIGISILLLFVGVILFPICLIPGSCIVLHRIIKNRL